MKALTLPVGYERRHPLDGDSPCWLWPGSVRPNGYGEVMVDARTAYPHRLAYQLHVGPIPRGWELDHVCHTLAVQRGTCEGGPSCIHRSCWNPAHLEAVSSREERVIKALSCHQPWASLIAEGIKTIETRSWAAPVSMLGQRFAVHAAKKRPRDQWRDFRSGRPFPAELAPFYDEGRYVDHQESSDGDWWRYRWDGPLGAVVATARLVDCVPIVEFQGITVHDGPMERVENAAGCVHVEGDRLTYWWHHDAGFRDVSDQRPYGDFQPGRWAWLLADVEKLDVPVPATGRQGLWEWHP